MDKKMILASKNLDSDEEHKTLFSDKLSKFINKKNMKIILLIVVAIISLIVFWGFSNGDNDSKSKESVSISKGYTTTIDYCELLENKLTEVLSSVDGAGQVKVMITVDGSPELVYANEKDQTSSTNSSGSVTSSTYSSPIIITVNGSSSALVMTEILPKVKGVIVVSSGAGNVATKLNLLNAVSTLLDISSDQVTILKGV